jgi:hypothetical protein
VRSVKLDLQTREIDCREFAGSANPPILHRKEAFLRPDDPLRARFERLTRQEERAGCWMRRRRSAQDRGGRTA